MAGEHSSPDIVSKSRKPLRVIDVAATLRSVGGICFKKPDAAMDFHVISHTWSQEVRKFSEDIGGIVWAKRNSGTSTFRFASVYNDAFQDANFSESECYKQLKVFFKMLEDDGVEYVWFDALCIDQTNADEKGIEIGRMAGYYSNNKGCYVLTHGIGQGYNFWQTREVERNNQRPTTKKVECNNQGSKAKEVKQKNQRSFKSRGQECVLPRWFKRAWTLQEYVLPTKLTYLVAFKIEVVPFINQFIESKQCGVGFCKCCKLVDRKTFLTFAKQYCENYEKNGTQEDPKMIYERNEKCEKCGSFPLVRKATNRDAKEMVYFVDRYAHMVLSALLYAGKHDKIKWNDQNTVRLLTLSRQSPMTVARHISDRECSNEEDRILCILGLLGSNDENPVRTGVSLDEQILRVCKNNEDLLIQLCAMSIKGNYKPGMSWAPWLVPDTENISLVKSATQYRLCPGKITKRDVEVVNVSSKGIKLCANIIRNRVIGLVGSQNSLVRTEKDGTNVTMCRHKSFGLVATDPQEPYHGYLHMPLRNYSDVNEVEFEMWWILLGDTQRLHRNCKVVMACVGKDEDHLHKIGLFWIPSKLATSKIFQILTSPKRPCCVGGFGENLDEYVTPSSEKYAGVESASVTAQPKNVRPRSPSPLPAPHKKRRGNR